MALTQWIERFNSCRQDTVRICDPLETEDYVVQPSADVSPPKWHLAHTTWFFENFILKPDTPDYKPFHPEFMALFNSYYKSQGQHWIQGHRGHLSRPTVQQIFEYRATIDEKIRGFFFNADPEHMPKDTLRLLETGIHHEQQHQELLLMDIKFILGHGPIKTPYSPRPSTAFVNSWIAPEFIRLSGGTVNLGADPSPETFLFCNESPRHPVILQDFALQNRPILNGEFLEFLQTDGYKNPLLWKSDGWNHIQNMSSPSPLYWFQVEGQWHEFTLHGFTPLDVNAPVSHISFYEADAFAQWAGARLPTEMELEYVYGSQPERENPSNDQPSLHPQLRATSNPFFGLNGCLWEWTTSDYPPYPRYKKPLGALGEYNQKFMINQKVLRGGSYGTPKAHFRETYRNFYAPEKKWAFTGLRLAKDL